MRNDFESNYLAHHGILGMKWGHKNGPPYPLGASDHSSSEKKAGWKKSLGGGRNESLYDRKISKYRKKQNEYATNAEDIKSQGYGESYAYDYLNKKANKYKAKADKIEQRKNRRLTDNQKKALKIGATVAVAALATYGVYKVSKDPRVKALINVGKVSAQQAALRNKQKLDAVNLAKSDKLIKDAILSAEKLAKTAEPHRSASTTAHVLEFGTSTQKFTKSDADRLSEISNNLLREAQKRNGIATSNTTSFDYAKELLKKNKATLSQYTMQDLKDLDLY